MVTTNGPGARHRPPLATRQAPRIGFDFAARAAKSDVVHGQELGARLHCGKVGHGIGRVRKESHTIHVGASSLEQFQPFRAQLHQRRTGDVATRPRQTGDEPSADRIAARSNTIGIVWSPLSAGAAAVLPAATMTSRPEPTSSDARAARRSNLRPQRTRSSHCGRHAIPASASPCA